MTRTKVLLFYDGKCNVCNAAVHFTINRVNRKAEFYYASLQSQFAKDKLEKLGINCFEDKRNPDIPTTSAVIINGRGYTKSEASIKALEHLLFPYNILGYLLSFIPTFIGDWAYSKFAANRFFLFGGTHQIQELPKGSEHLFLDRNESFHQCPIQLNSQ